MPKKASFSTLDCLFLQTGLCTQKQLHDYPIKDYRSELVWLAELQKNNILDDNNLYELAHEVFCWPFAQLNAFTLKAMAALVSTQPWLYKKYQFIPLHQDEQNLFLALAHPQQVQAFAELQFYCQRQPQPILVRADELLQYLHYLGLARHYSDDLKDALDSPTTKVTTEDVSIIRFVNNTLSDAVYKQASDIHFENYEKTYRVRMRIDGLLYEISHPSQDLAGRIATRLKLLAQLDIAEKRRPQDGRFKMTLQQRDIDFRVSTCPTINGEKIVLRLLDPTQSHIQIENLGLLPKQQQQLKQTLHSKQGMVLATGPTGSGKSMTLHSALQLLNQNSCNIATVEDPVEIYLKGINQVNINGKINLNFAAVLRTFLRQDPDIIMVGEMRDLETAEISIQAAQTGHLVLSTLHTNNASETLTRLYNMGIPRYHIASSMALIIGQRLARKLCPHCKLAEQVSAQTIQESLNSASQLHEASIFKANKKGCAHCHYGYQGRLGIFELLPITDPLIEGILQGWQAHELQRQAIHEGMVPLKQAALDKVQQGLTSLEEIHRVIKVNS
jgi:type IV pilus assembly protein PilB